MVLDASNDLEEEDLEILKLVEDKKVIYLKNKTDLEDKLNLSEYKNVADRIINISVLKNEGLEKITNAIQTMFFEGKIDIGNDLIINNARQKNLLINAANNLKEVLKSIENGMSIDFIEIDLKACMENLGLIVGKAVSDDLIDKIFSDFCIGK